MQQYIARLQERYVDQPIKWATLGGLVLVIIGVLGPWGTVHVLGVRIVSTNGFDHSGGIVFFLAVLALAAILVYAFANLNVQRSQLMWGLVGVVALIDLLVLVALIDITGTEGYSTGWGLRFTVVGAVLASVGAIVPMWGEIRSKADEMRQRGS